MSYIVSPFYFKQTFRKKNYLDVDKRTPFTKPNVESATNIEIIHEKDPISFSEKVFKFKFK